MNSGSRAEVDRLIDVGLSEYESGDLERAAAAFRRAIALDPGRAQAHAQLGRSLASLGDWAGALAAFDSELRIDPRSVAAHCNRAQMLLGLGDYRRGFEEYEWRWQLPELQTIRGMFARPWWDGSALNGRTILLFAEQGFGDAIQFIRFAPLVAQAGARVVVDCHPPLKSLFAQASGVAQVLASDAEIANYELCAPLMGLPRIFGTTLDDIPAEVPYLSVPAAHAAKWRAKLGAAPPALRIGLVWGSNPDIGYAWRKSLPPDALAPLARFPGAVYYSLQIGSRGGAAAQLPGLKLVDLTEELRDFADTAALISNLDLVIAVDTAVAHLAGALGKPVWTLLPRDSDWRWLADRADSPWYPTMRLFRQRTEGDWDEVVGQLAAALKEFAGARAAR